MDVVAAVFRDTAFVSAAALTTSLLLASIHRRDAWAPALAHPLTYALGLDNPKVVPKSEQMPQFHEPVRKGKRDSIQILNPDVQLYGDVAILTSQEAVAGGWEGQPSRYAGQVTIGYVKHRDAWRGTHYHGSE